MRLRAATRLPGMFARAVFIVPGVVACFFALAISVLAGSSGALAQQADARRAFLEAAANGDAGTLARLIASGVPVDTRDGRGRTALLIATYRNAVAAAKILIKAGADVNAMDDRQDSPYLYAGAEGRLEILRLTLKVGADLASVNRYGGTALTPAAHHGHVDTVRLLLKTRIDIDQVNNLGWTALLEAVILGDGGPRHREIVRLLVEAGAKVNLPDSDGVTPLAHARKRGYSEIAKTLEAAGARS